MVMVAVSNRALLLLELCNVKPETNSPVCHLGNTSGKALLHVLGDETWGQMKYQPLLYTTHSKILR